MDSVAGIGANRRLRVFLWTAVWLAACDATSGSRATASLDEPSPPFRNVDTPTGYVGDGPCVACHADAAAAYERHGMAHSFHRWTPETRMESALDRPLHHAPTGFYYTIAQAGDTLYQVEYLIGPEGRRLHELRRRVDYVMGSGSVARTYFTEEHGRLFQLPLTWYREKGWDFSPGYELNNARFDRLLPDRCLACHSSYPEPLPFLEGKYAELRPGIGCERCHGPGALHVDERSAGLATDTTYDNTIVNPAKLPFERRLDVCEQCHVHTPVTVLREGRSAFDYVPSQPLSEHAAFFKVAGGIDIVSHADRLRQSACFIVTRSTAQPLECATCHDPHEPARNLEAQNQPCQACHVPAALQRRLAASPSLVAHTTTASCVDCHMPKVKERTVPHGSFTDHWIRVVDGRGAQPEARRDDDDPIEPYYERDRTGPDADIYQGMGEVVYATLANDARVLSNAAGELEEALERDTTRADAHFLLGLAYHQLDRSDDAIGALERSVRIDPDRPERLHALARALIRAGRSPVTVDSLYRRALGLQPALAWIRADYADFLRSQFRRTEAEQAYRGALSERPSLDVAAFNLGTLLAAQGRLTEASDAFEDAVRLSPSLAEALSPLLHVRTTGNVVTGVRVLGSPLPTLPVRDRGPNAVRLSVSPGASLGVQFVSVPHQALIHVVDPSGGVVRAMRAGEASVVTWNLLTEDGSPIMGGLYRVRVLGPSPGATQTFHIGIVRAERQ